MGKKMNKQVDNKIIKYRVFNTIHPHFVYMYIGNYPNFGMMMTLL